MLRICVGVVFSLLLVNAARTEESGAKPPVESRKHVTVNDARGNVLYVVTSITTVSDLGDAGYLLVLDKVTDQRYVVTSSYDIAGHRSLTSVSDVAVRKYIRVSHPLPFSAKNRDELATELQANPHLLDLADPIMTVETAEFSQTLHDTEISRIPPGARWLSDLRASLDPAFLEGLERMRTSLFGTTVGEPGYLSFKFLFHGGCPPDANANVVTEAPDCSFDKSFGLACSERQLERISKAAKEKRTLERY
jgi:hypothetical protein